MDPDKLGSTARLQQPWDLISRGFHLHTHYFFFSNKRCVLGGKSEKLKKGGCLLVWRGVSLAQWYKMENVDIDGDGP